MRDSDSLTAETDEDKETADAGGHLAQGFQLHKPSFFPLKVRQPLQGQSQLPDRPLLTDSEAAYAATLGNFQLQNTIGSIGGN